jgi:hypothetical protein
VEILRQAQYTNRGVLFFTEHLPRRKYIVHVNKPGRAVITLWNDKKNKEIGAASFEVIEK